LGNATLELHHMVCVRYLSAMQFMICSKQMRIVMCYVQSLMHLLQPVHSISACLCKLPVQLVLAL
jgi:hypothetical protein